MNCIDIHRKLTIEPNNTDDRVLAHLTDCPACANFAASIKQFDDALITAAKIDVPDRLAERILLQQNLKQQHQQRSMRYKMFAVAASLILVIGISANVTTFKTLFGYSLSLEEVTLNHVINEKNHLKDQNNVQLASLNQVLQPFNIRLKNSIGQINYADACPIRHSRGAHIILREKNSSATVLVMPGEYVSARKSATKAGLTTIIIPIKNGSIAIITDKASGRELPKHLEHTLRQSISYI